MSRASRSQAQENRQRIVAIASRMFREKGTAVSIADLMKTTGLTHGGFYKHFTPKDDLVDEANAHAFADPGSHRPAQPRSSGNTPKSTKRSAGGCKLRA